MGMPTAQAGRSLQVPVAPTPLGPSPPSLSSSGPLLKHRIPSLALCWLCSTRKEGPRPPLYWDSSSSHPIPLILNSSPSSSTSFPGGSVGKESVCNAEDLGSVSGWGRSPGGGHGNPLQYSCLENPHGQRNLADCSPWGCKESDTTEQLTHTYLRTSSSVYKCVQVSTSQNILCEVLALLSSCPSTSGTTAPGLPHPPCPPHWPAVCLAHPPACSNCSPKAH